MHTRLLTTIHRAFTILVLIMVLAGAARPAAAELTTGVTYTVDSSNDSVSSGAPDGICDDGSGRCTLREAIKEANNAPGGVTTSINFAIQNTTINLTLGALVISGNNIIITGPIRPTTLIIDGTGNLNDSDNIDIEGNNNSISSLYVHNARRHGIWIGSPGAGSYGMNNTVMFMTVGGSQGSGIYLHGASGSGIYSTDAGALNWNDTRCTAGMGNQSDGITIDEGSSNNIIDTNRVVCNTGSGISLSGSSTNHNYIVGNWIGVGVPIYGVTAGYAMGNGHSGITDTSAGYTRINSNHIAGNAWYGIWLRGSTDATVTNNRIGLDAQGIAAMANGYDGIRLSDGASNNRVGSDTTDSAGNFISGNDGCGVTLTSLAHDNLVSGNFIGVEADMITAAPNGQAGVSISGGAHHNDLGSDYSGAPIQIVSGNTREGIYIENSDNNSVHASNYVGLAGNPGSSPSLPLGNGREGLRLVEASNTMIKGHYAYNGLAGIAIEGSTSSYDMIIPAIDFGNGGLAVDLGNDGFTPNGARTPPGPNNWLPYPLVTGTDAGHETFSGTTCNHCTVFIYKAIGNPAVPGGGGQAIGSSPSYGGDWIAYPPPGVRSSDISMIACTNDLAGSCSEMSPRPTFYIPLIRKPVP